MQLKAEVRLLADVEATLRMVSSVYARANGTMQSLASKQELLSLLLENEQTRLVVWLYPLDPERRHFFSSSSGKSPSDVSSLENVWSDIALTLVLGESFGFVENRLD